MKVTIRMTTEIAFSVTIPDNSTVEDLRNSAKVASPSTLPGDFKLIRNGEKLAPFYRKLEEFNIKPDQSDNIVILMSEGADVTVEEDKKSGLSEASGEKAMNTSNGVGRPKKTKKNKCSFQSCSGTPLRMVGDCSHCGGKFCAKHRLLEDHYCQGLQVRKDNAHERNAMKLESEKTIANKV